MTARFDINGHLDAQRVVDEFLSESKIIEGEAVWTKSRGADEHRIKWPLTVDGLLTKSSLDVTAYPMNNDYPFTITLNFPPCIWRLDHIPSYQGHTNPLVEFSQFDNVIHGPHYHSWADNGHTSAPNALPIELEHAQPLPNTIRTYEQAFRWFCDETNIVVPNGEIVELPTRERLL